MRRIYNHDLRDWPHFEWDRDRLAEPLAAVRLRQGRLIGHMEALGFPLRTEAVLQTLTSDVIKSSEIEGERLDAEQVRSSIARRLGVDIGALKPADRNVEGVVEMMLDATRQYDDPLTATPAVPLACVAFSNRPQRPAQDQNRPLARRQHRAHAGGLRSRSHREKVHFEAPAAARLPEEMKAFLKWFNARAQGDAVMKAALAHLWFVTCIRLTTATDGSRARSPIWRWRDRRAVRSASTACRRRSGRSATRITTFWSGPSEERMDVTPWMDWFLGCLGRAIDGAQTTLKAVLAKARFWETFGATPLNDRQRKVVNRLLDGFEGKLTTSKYAKLTKCSQDTALRDILSLVDRGILVRGERRRAKHQLRVGRNWSSDRKNVIYARSW